MADTLVFNPAVQLGPFDSDAREGMVLCEVPRSDGTSARFVVPSDVVELLRLFDGSRPVAALLVEAKRRLPDRSPAELQALVDDVRRRRLLVPAGGGIGAPSGDRAPRTRYLLFRIRLLSAAVVVPVARRFGWMFTSPAAATALSVITVAHIAFYAFIVPARDVDVRHLHGGDALGILALAFVGAVLHELGHATAAVRYGCRRIEIGYGLYYYFMVLYTELSEVWRLPRRQRAVVDMGGMYFQAVFAVLLLVLHLATGWMAPLYVFVIVDLAIASSLNPFLRMDGYWLVTDVFGLPNLHAQSARLAEAAVHRVLGRGRGRTPWPIARRATIVLSVYSVLAVAAFSWMMVFVVDRLVVGLFQTYPEQWGAVWAAVTREPISMLGVVSAFFEVLWRSLALFGMGMFLRRAITGVCGGVWRLIRSWLADPPALAGPHRASRGAQT